MTRVGLALLELSKTYPVSSLVANLSATIEPLTVDYLTLPCTLPEKGKNQAWTVSLRSMIIGAGRDELVKLPAFSRFCCKILLKLLDPLLTLGQVDKLACLNNAALSTNLYDQGFEALDKERLTRVAQTNYPNRALMIRSLNRHHHGNILQAFEEAGWLTMVSRQIYLLDQVAEALELPENRKDAMLMDDGRYRFRQVTIDSPWEDFLAAENLYQQLYLGKYSQTNLDFQALLLKELVARDALVLYLLDDQDGQAQACLGMIVEKDVLTTPILGYNRDLPMSEGLYRRLCLFIKRYCKDKGLRQHSSSGAPDFKRRRGAYPYLEYSVLYVKHLPWYRRLFWQGLVGLSHRFYGPLLERKEL